MTLWLNQTWKLVARPSETNITEIQKCHPKKGDEIKDEFETRDESDIEGMKQNIEVQ